MTAPESAPEQGGSRPAEHEGEAAGEPRAAGVRSEGGSWSTVSSLLALALIGLMLLHACMKPAATPAAATPSVSAPR